ncbi:MAG: DUF192 domain-containing protein [Bacillota bacterium]
MKKITVRNLRNNKIIGDKIELADTFYLRLKGLLGYTGLGQGEGMLLTPCSSIHCIGMKFTIDVIFVDIDKKVIWLRENMQPGTKETKLDSVHVLELAAGEVAKQDILMGDTLMW